jgi:hypothetical protein
VPVTYRNDLSVASRRRPRGRTRESALVLVGFGCLSVLLYGGRVLGDPTHLVVGSGQGATFYGRDQGNFVWFLAWAEHSLVHLQNPLLTGAVYAPHGYNLAWATSILGPGVLLAPLTALAGAVATYNVLILAAPAAAAWAAFLLCRELAGRGPALAGGLLFGFGTYESGEMVNHVHLALVALLPLAALLVLRRRAGAVSRRSFVCALGGLLALQLWTASEVFASLVLFGAAAFAIGMLLGGAQNRRAAASLAAESMAALVVGLSLAAPLLYFALRDPNPLTGYSSANAGADLANFVVPTRVTWLHGSGRLAAVAHHLALNVTEQLAYLGLPLLAILVIFAVRGWRRPLGRCLLAFVAVAAVASLGGHLVVDGHQTGVVLPWHVIAGLPFVQHAIPARFVVYLWLAAAVCVACWLNERPQGWARWALYGLAVVCVLPNLTGMTWATRVDQPTLMTSPALARLVPPGATVLALPFGMDGNSMEWHVEAGFRFRLAGGYISWAPPAGYRRLSVLQELAGRRPRRDSTRRLCSFIARTRTRVILARDHSGRWWRALLDPLGVRPVHAGGFLVYRVAGALSSRRGEGRPSCARGG